MINSSVQVSIVILNYNTFNETCNCIKSIYKYTTDVEYEVILVDNASIECNPDLFKELFPEIILIKSEVNLGFSKGCNLGIENSTGRYILLLNSDTILFENSILLSYNYFKTLINPGVLSIKLLNADATVQYNCGRFPGIKKSFFELFRLQKVFKNFGSEYLLGSFFTYNKNIEVDWLWGTFFYFEKSSLSRFENNKLNDDFFMYCEDLLWCYEFKAKNYKNYYYSETAIIHLHKGDGTFVKNEHAVKNYYIFFNKYYNSFHQSVIQILNYMITKSNMKIKINNKTTL